MERRKKERWLLTRKTFRYMSDAGKRLFPDGASTGKKEDIPKIEENFQHVCKHSKEFILWQGPRNKQPQEHSTGKTESLIADIVKYLPADVYQQLVRIYGVNALHHALEEQLMEEDEDGEPQHEVGAQTEPYLDMCVQTDSDLEAEDCVKVGAETREETEAAVAHAHSQSRGSTKLKKILGGRRESTSQQPSGSPQKAQEKQRGLASEKDKEAPPPKGGVAAKLKSLEAAAAQGSGTQPLQFGQKPGVNKDKKPLKNVFKLGLKCDVQEANQSDKGTKKDKQTTDKFKTVNYDKTLRYIKSKWVPSEDDVVEVIEEEIPGVPASRSKRKTKAVQVGESLPQFILDEIRLCHSPVEIVYAPTCRRRLSSSDFSSPTSPRYSINELPENDILRLFTGIKRSEHIESSNIPRTPSALHLLWPRESGTSIGGLSTTSIRSSYSLIQSILPAVMQRARPSGSSRLVPKKIWRTRSKSQSRASSRTTCVWTPMGGNTWMSVTGRVVTVEETTLLNLTELERLALQGVAVAKLQALNLGCAIRIPKESSTFSSSKKRRPYLLKKKSLSSGIFDKKEDAKENGTGLVFGIPLSKCVESERQRQREVAERLASPPASDGEGGSVPSRSSSQRGSNTSFTSLLEGAKQATTGSLESLNIERKRFSLVCGDIRSPATPSLLTVDPHPQVPSIVTGCFRYLKQYGLHTLGIFRVSSSKKRVRQLREEFDNGRDVAFKEDHCPHDVATLLKEFFRDLPEPLLTRDLYEPLICTQKIRNRKLQLEAIQHLIQLLPTANRDTLFSLLNFLSVIAENAVDSKNKTGETVQGNRMDSNNLATLFAPNVLHVVKPGSDIMSQMADHAEERIDVINVMRSMIDHNSDLFTISAELLDETYQHLMDSHPDALDVLLRRRCSGNDDIRSENLRTFLEFLLRQGHQRDPGHSKLADQELDTSSSILEGSECSTSLPRSPTEILEFERFRSSGPNEESEVRIKMQTTMNHCGHHQIISRPASGEQEDVGKRSIACLEDARRLRRREKLELEELSFPKNLSREPNDREKRNTPKKASVRGKEDATVVVEDSSGEECTLESLRSPEPTVRRLSSPELDVNVISASLRIPVPQQPSRDSPRQRTGSNDSYLGQPITGTMSFQPRASTSRDSVLSSSSADVFSPDGMSSPISGAASPPPVLSPDSGTAGLSPPGSPPPPLTHSSSRDRVVIRGSTPGIHPVGRSRTSDILKESTKPIPDERATGRRYVRRRYAGDRGGVSIEPNKRTQLWKRWEIIASDPTEPETFV